MKVIEAIELLNGKYKINTLAKHIKLPEKKLRNALISVGCAYDNSLKRWTTSSVIEQDLNKSLSELVGELKSATNDIQMNSNKTTTIVEVKNNDLTTVQQDFTLEEIKILKKMAAAYLEGKTEEKKLSTNSIHNRVVKELSSDRQTTRKTLFVSKEVVSDLEAFSKRTRLKQSDIVELALKDFLLKYQ